MASRRFPSPPLSLSLSLSLSFNINHLVQSIFCQTHRDSPILTLVSRCASRSIVHPRRRRSRLAYFRSSACETLQSVCVTHSLSLSLSLFRCENLWRNFDPLANCHGTVAGFVYLSDLCTLNHQLVPRNAIDQKAVCSVSSFPPPLFFARRLVFRKTRRAKEEESR